MDASKRAGVEEPFMAEIAFTTSASLHRDYGGENFVHEIFGKMSVRNMDDESEEMAGELRAWLIQFIEAQAHGVSPRVLADGHSLELSRYWQELFDLDDFNAEIQADWQPEGSDLLVISSIQIVEQFEGQGIRLAALGRTIDLFGRSCDLVAYFPEGATPERARPSLVKADPTLKADCLKAGFRLWRGTGIYLMNPSQERPDVLLE